MADRLEGNAFSSPSKRLKLGVNSYAVILDNVGVSNGIGSGDHYDTEDAFDRSREGSDEPPPFSRSPSLSNDDDFDAFVGRRRTKSGVTSSSDLKDGEEVYLSNCGDSGFNEMTPPSSTGCIETNSSTDLDEPDSSTACGPQRKGNELEPREEDEDEEEEDDDDDDACEVASTVSHLSGISDLSEMSGQEWKATAGPMSWVQRQMISGISPRILLQQILPQGSKIPDQVDDLTLWKVIVNIMNEPPRRKKLSTVNTFDDVLNLLRTSRRIIVLTGAGVSVSCGIPDFRSHDGIYARLAKDFPDLPDPQAMFDIQYFKRDPRPFYKFAKEIFPGLFEPSACHRFIKLLEDMGKLLRNYTQNIDTLEQIVGIQKVIECHGSFATASCLRCKYKVAAAAIRDDIFNQTIPNCPKCKSDTDELAIMKPDIVFFGEGLSDEFHSAMNVDKDQCDLLIVIGSSLKVRPVALIPSSIPNDVPQILINRERLPHMNFDVELLGDCDIIINEICHRLRNGWSHLCCRDTGLVELNKLPTDDQSASEPSEVAEVTSEHSNDPCDSTSFPHRNTKYKDASSDCTVDCSSNCGSGCDGLFVAKAATAAINPDSTNVVSEESLCMRASTSSEIPSSHKEGVPVGEKETTRIDDCKPQQSISTLLPDDSYLFCRPNRYVFRGAAVYEINSDSDSDSESGADGDDSSSSESCSELSDADFADNFEVERLQNKSEENGRLS